MAYKNLKDTGFDLARLQAMEEPLSIRIERNKNGRKSPIDLPEGPNNWTRENAQQLEKKILDFCGGGDFRATVADVKGAQMVWSFGYDEAQYPSRIPETNASASAYPANTVIPRPQPVGGSPMSYQQPLPIQPVAVAAPVVAPQWQPPPLGWQAPQWSQARTPETADERARALEDKLRAAEQRAIETEHKAEVARKEEAHKAEMSAMREEMRRLADGMKAPPPVNDELAQMRTMMAAQKAEFEQREQVRERERAEERHRNEMAMLTAKMDQLANIVQNQGPKVDPTIEFMKESLRQSSEIAKETARAQAQQFEKLSMFMVSPMQMMEMNAKRGDGSEGLLRTVTESVGSIIELQRKMFEGATNLTSGPAVHPAQAMIENAVEKGSAMFQSFMQSKRDIETSSSRAAAATAQAQAQMAQVEYLKAQNVKQALAGAQPLAESKNGQNGSATIVTKPESPPTTATHASPTALPNAQPLTEQDLFGAAWASVQRLRLGVSTEGVTPAQAVDAVLQGINQIQTNPQIPMPPVFGLLQEERFADFWDALLPKAPTAYKVACIQEMMKRAGMQVPPESEDDGPEEAEAN